MTDEEKIQAMFDIGKAERPDLADAAYRVEKVMFNKGSSAYWNLLNMYNDRFGRE